MNSKIMKSKTILVSAFYTVVTWIVVLLNKFNTGANDTYSLIIFSAYIILAIFGICAMYLAVIISGIVSITKNAKNKQDKSAIMTCVINSLISITLISTIHISYAIIAADFHC